LERGDRKKIAPNGPWADLTEDEIAVELEKLWDEKYYKQLERKLSGE